MAVDEAARCLAIRQRIHRDAAEASARWTEQQRAEGRAFAQDLHAEGRWHGPHFRGDTTR